MVAKHLLLRVGKEAPVAEETAAVEAAVVSGPQLVELFGRLNRQRAQHDLIDQREDGGGCADTQRQCQHGGKRKAWCAAKLPQSVTKVLHDLLDELHESSSLWVCGYSMRSATIGSMEAARRAGTRAATAAASESTARV